MKKRSLGLIETWGYVPAVEAVDAGTKAANVTFLGYEITRTALVTVKFVGDVAAVKAAVAAGEVAAKKVGRVVSVHVIPRPDPQLRIEPPKGPPAPEMEAKKPTPPATPKKEASVTKSATPPKEAKAEVKPEPAAPLRKKKKGVETQTGQSPEGTGAAPEARSETKPPPKKKRPSAQSERSSPAKAKAVKPKKPKLSKKAKKT